MGTQMNAGLMQDLVRQTLTSPRAAAERLMAMGLPLQWLWMALALMCILNAIVYSISLALVPAVDPVTGAQLVPGMFQSPIVFAGFLGVALVLTVLMLGWVGRGMGGQAQTGDLLVLIVWMQVLRLGVQLVMLLVAPVAPVLGVLFIVVASFWGLVILCVFIQAAHRFETAFKAVLVLIVAILAMAAGSSLVLGAVSTAIPGGS
ncbi:MAG: Yip1 family protein [Roseovarius sp.]